MILKFRIPRRRRHPPAHAAPLLRLFVESFPQLRLQTAIPNCAKRSRMSFFPSLMFPGHFFDTTRHPADKYLFSPSDHSTNSSPSHFVYGPVNGRQLLTTPTARALQHSLHRPLLSTTPKPYYAAPQVCTTYVYRPYSVSPNGVRYAERQMNGFLLQTTVTLYSAPMLRLPDSEAVTTGLFDLQRS